MQYPPPSQATCETAFLILPFNCSFTYQPGRPIWCISAWNWHQKSPKPAVQGNKETYQFSTWFSVLFRWQIKIIPQCPRMLHQWIIHNIKISTVSTHVWMCYRIIPFLITRKKWCPIYDIKVVFFKFQYFQFLVTGMYMSYQKLQFIRIRNIRKV